MSEIQNERDRPALKTVVVHMKDSSWNTMSETLNLDSKSNMFDKELRDEIRSALDDTEITYKGDIAIITTTISAWDIIIETLEADSRSKAFDTELRSQISAALLGATRMSI